jgi:hypothetical protein
MGNSDTLGAIFHGVCKGMRSERSVLLPLASPFDILAIDSQEFPKLPALLRMHDGLPASIMQHHTCEASQHHDTVSLGPVLRTGYVDLDECLIHDNPWISFSDILLVIFSECCSRSSCFATKPEAFSTCHDSHALRVEQYKEVGRKGLQRDATTLTSRAHQGALDSGLGNLSTIEPDATETIQRHAHQTT